MKGARVVRVSTWLLVGLSVIALVGNGWMYMRNRAKADAITERVKFVQQTVQLSGLYNDIVRSLAELAVRNQDDQLRELLRGQGISLGPAKAPTAQEQGGGKGGK